MMFDKQIFSKDTTFLVTGGAGFIGSNICDAILKLGCNVRCLDNLSTGNIDNVKIFSSNPNYKFIDGDIRNFETCLNACDGVDYVLHQAALGSVPRSLKQPVFYLENNVLGMANILEASRIKNVKRMVYASSSSVYGDSCNLPQKEGYEGNLLSPYAATKKFAEEYAKQYTLNFGVDTCGLRYFNVFGPRQNPYGTYSAVIPKFINLLFKNERPTIYGNGEQSRDFTFIDNVIDANLKACQVPEPLNGEIFNIACGKQESLLNLYNILADILNKNINPIFAPPRKGDILHSFADISKARRILNYSPSSLSFRSELELTVDWYKKIFLQEISAPCLIIKN